MQKQSFSILKTRCFLISMFPLPHNKRVDFENLLTRQANKILTYLGLFDQNKKSKNLNSSFILLGGMLAPARLARNRFLGSLKGLKIRAKYCCPPPPPQQCNCSEENIVCTVGCYIYVHCTDGGREEETQYYTPYMYIHICSARHIL